MNWEFGKEQVISPLYIATDKCEVIRPLPGASIVYYGLETGEDEQDIDDFIYEHVFEAKDINCDELLELTNLGESIMDKDQDRPILNGKTRRVIWYMYGMTYSVSMSAYEVYNTFNDISSKEEKN